MSGFLARLRRFLAACAGLVSAIIGIRLYTLPPDDPLAVAVAGMLAAGLLGLAWLLWVKRPSAPAGDSKTVNYLIPGPDDEPLTPREIYVAGVTRTGLCGRPRQKLLADCEPGETIFLIRERENPHDPNAVLLYREDGTDIGYLPRDTAAEIAPRLDAGSPVTAVYSRTEPFETDDGRTLLGGRVEITPHRMRRKKGQGSG